MTSANAEPVIAGRRARCAIATVRQCRADEDVFSFFAKSLHFANIGRDDGLPACERH